MRRCFTCLSSVSWERNLSTSSVRAVFWVLRMAVYSSRSARDAFSASKVLLIPFSCHDHVHQTSVSTPCIHTHTYTHIIPAFMRHLVISDRGYNLQLLPNNLISPQTSPPAPHLLIQLLHHLCCVSTLEERPHQVSSVEGGCLLGLMGTQLGILGTDLLLESMNFLLQRLH